MPTSYAVDTHALIWYLEDNPRLSAAARSILDDSESHLFLPIIALAEACWIVERGRTSIPTVADLLSDVYADPRIVLVPLDQIILDISISLAAIGEMHDRLIVATALHLTSAGEPVALLSRDENIRSSGLVPIVW